MHKFFRLYYLLMRTQGKAALHFISPSIVSGSVSLLSGCLLVMILLISHWLHYGSLAQLLYNWQLDASLQTVGDPFHAATIDATVNSTVSAILGLILWITIGLCLFAFSMAIYFTIRNIKQVKKELGYVNANRRTIIRNLLMRSCVRFVAVICLLCGIIIVAGYVLPTTMKTTDASIRHISYVTSLHAAIWLLLFMLSTHLLFVFSRIIALKARVFTNA